MKKNIIYSAIGIIALLLFVVWVKSDTNPVTDNTLLNSNNNVMGTSTSGITLTPPPVQKYDHNSTVVLHTNLGDITIELFNTTMPITAGNFQFLVSQGFYDDTIFHRVIGGFVIQGGDPTGTGTGGPGYTIPDELTAANSNLRGTVAMANAGPNTGGSQFFINLIDNTSLDLAYPVFGKVTAGMDVVDKIGSTATDANDKPTTDIVINSAELL